MDRTYLFVPPEEKAEVQALGAQWDSSSKRWYIGPEDAPAKFLRWLPSAVEDEELTITSDEGYVAATEVACQRCGADIEVICIHCASGTSDDEHLTQFTVSDVGAMDEALANQLQRWPNFRRSKRPNGEPGNFANHCPNCNAPQEDLYLHAEPGDAFFDIPRAPPGSIRLIPLTGKIRLNGGEHFTVD
jgi:Domain of unknown function (DUF5710)